MSLYFNYLKIHLKSLLEYKTSFILSFLSQIMGLALYYFTLICLFQRFSNVKGFTLYEVLLAYSVIEFGIGVSEAFFAGMDKFDRLIMRGDFDKLLLRPRNIILQVLGEEFNFVKTSRIVEAFVIFIIVFINLDINWNIYRVITFISMLISSVTILLSLFIFAASYCFITIKGLEVRNVFTYGCRKMAAYPIGIFKKGFVIFFTYIIPFGFVNYYPLLYLLGRNDLKILSISPLITLLYLVPSVLLFYRGVRKYASVGS